jgi:hypothetical protein
MELQFQPTRSRYNCNEDTTRFRGVEFSISAYTQPHTLLRSFDHQRVENGLE